MDGHPYEYPINEERLTYAAEHGLIFESSNAWWCHWLSHGGWNAITETADGLVLVGVLGETIYPRHNMGLNITFCDGHVKWMSSRGVYDKAMAEHPYPRMFSFRQQ